MGISHGWQSKDTIRVFCCATSNISSHGMGGRHCIFYQNKRQYSTVTVVVCLKCMYISMTDAITICNIFNDHHESESMKKILISSLKHYIRLLLTDMK